MHNTYIGARNDRHSSVSRPHSLCDSTPDTDEEQPARMDKTISRDKLKAFKARNANISSYNRNKAKRSKFKVTAESFRTQSPMKVVNWNRTSSVRTNREYSTPARKTVSHDETNGYGSPTTNGKPQSAGDLPGFPRSWDLENASPRVEREFSTPKGRTSVASSRDGHRSLDCGNVFAEKRAVTDDTENVQHPTSSTSIIVLDTQTGSPTYSPSGKADTALRSPSNLEMKHGSKSSSRTTYQTVLLGYGKGSLHKIPSVKRPRFGNDGFRNLGNTCYVNAGLQALLSVVPFVQDFKVLEKDSRRLAGRPLSRALLDIVLAQQRPRFHSQKVAMDASQIKVAVGKSFKQFEGKEQQDVHEFLGCCLDLLDHEAGTGSSEDKNTVTNLNFACEIEHTRSCMNTECSTPQSKPIIELFHNFSLDLPEGLETQPSIQSMIEDFFEAEEVEYKCETCGCGVSKFNHRMSQLPRAIGIHIKRFNSVNGEKLNRQVLINRTINFGFCSSGRTQKPPEMAMNTETNISAQNPILVEDRAATPRRTLFAETKPVGLDRTKNPSGLSEEEQLEWALQESTRQYQQELYGVSDIDKKSTIAEETPMRQPLDADGSPEHTYKLVAVVRHTGFSAQEGHYICDTWNPKSNTWRSFNDSHVVEVDEKMIYDFVRRRQVYLLYYVHVGYLNKEGRV